MNRPIAPERRSATVKGSSCDAVRGRHDQRVRRIVRARVVAVVRPGRGGDQFLDDVHQLLPGLRLRVDSDVPDSGCAHVLRRNVRDGPAAVDDVVLSIENGEEFLDNLGDRRRVGFEGLVRDSAPGHRSFEQAVDV